MSGTSSTRPAWPGPRLSLRYTDPAYLTRIHHVDGDGDNDSIDVVGNPDNASYEWVVRRGDEIKYSDVGYGMSAIALRDALVEYYGAPTGETACTRTRKVTQ